MDNATGLELLARCLSLEPSIDDTMRLRTRLLSDITAWERLFEIALSLRMMPALAVRLRQRGLIPPQPRENGANRLTPAALLDGYWTQHLGMRASQAAALARIIAALNRNAIEPILLKGAVSLWLEANQWRTMRDLDILVPGPLAIKANAVLKAEGYLPRPDAIDRPNRHHFELLFRSDMPGWVEVHRRAGNRYAEQFLPTAEIAANSVPVEHALGCARIAPAAHRIWHGLVHHHFGHSGFARSTVDLKGLYEFAMALRVLPGDEVDELVKLASRDSAGLAAFDLWIAAAVDLLAMPIPAGLTHAQDARATWGRMKKQNLGQDPEPKYRGYRSSIGLGWAGNRIKRITPVPPCRALSARLTVLNRLRPKLRRN
jgi:hypothetical protein